MRWTGLIIVLFVFYTILGFVFNAVAGIGNPADNTEPYDKNIEFRTGEYGMSDKYDFKNVAYPTYLGHGEDVVISGDLDFNMAGSTYTWTAARYHLILVFWDANNGNEITVKEIPMPTWGFDTPFSKGVDAHWDINGGDMPYTDYYFILYLYEAEKDLLPVHIDTWIFENKDLLREMYGGVIQGEEDMPLGFQPIVSPGRENSKNWLDWIGDFISGYAEGVEMIMEVPVFGPIINAALFGLVPILLGYMIYTEFKSWTPLVSGD